MASCILQKKNINKQLKTRGGKRVMGKLEKVHSYSPIFNVKMHHPLLSLGRTMRELRADDKCFSSSFLSLPRPLSSSRSHLWFYLWTPCGAERGKASSAGKGAPRERKRSRKRHMFPLFSYIPLRARVSRENCWRHGGKSFLFFLFRNKAKGFLYSITKDAAGSARKK